MTEPQEALLATLPPSPVVAMTGYQNGDDSGSQIAALRNGRVFYLLEDGWREDDPIPGTEAAMKLQAQATEAT